MFTYVNDQYEVYITAKKDGQLQNGSIYPFKISDKHQNKKQTTVCKVTDNSIFTVFWYQDTNNHYLKGKYYFTDGTLISDIEIYQKPNISMVNCLSTEQDTVYLGISYNDDQNTADKDSSILKIQLSTSYIIELREKFLNDDQNGNQGSAFIQQLQEPNQNQLIGVFYDDEQKLLICQAINLTSFSKSGDNFELTGQNNQTDIIGYAKPLSSTNDGGFIVPTVQGYFYYQYKIQNKQFELQCTDKIDGIDLDLIVINRKAYLVYIDFYYESSTQQAVWGAELNLDNCEIENKYLIATTIESYKIKDPRIVYYNQDINAEFFDIYYTVELETVFSQVNYVRYFYQDKQKCSNEKCSMCFDDIQNDTCNICSGSTEIARLQKYSEDEKCNCNSGFYLDNSSQDCKKCPDNCLTCSDGSTCTSCKAMNGRLPDCNCADDYKPNNLYEKYEFYWQPNANNNKITNITYKQCIQICDEKDKCVGFNFLKYNETCYLISENQETGLVGGPRRYCYQDQNTFCDYYKKFEQTQIQLCSCDSNCEFCQGSSSQCTSCAINRTGTPDCYCAVGFYESDQNCLECDNQCLSCFEKSNKCIKCKHAIGRSLSPPDCGCQDGYYELDGELQCAKCGIYCATCNNPNYCLTCQNPKASPPFCTSEQTFFIVTSEGNIQEYSCQAQCQSCAQTSQNCLTCVQGKHRETSVPPYCLCDQGYHNENGLTKDCFKCPVACTECISSSLCSKCQENLNRELNPYTGLCDCKYGYMQSKIKKLECVKCYYIQKTCVSKCPKGTLQDEQTHQCIIFQINKKSSMVYIFIGGGLLILSIITGYFYKNIFSFSYQFISVNQQEHQD
ncbi:Insulin-like growth factor binding protein, N-terminal [Pseudocohnilembus persalinus]|uniref:Insulin-like growth factor binding protein, N-terminal n=1 Tax=Pseudocohnilembus persalinus TaxID=266149 RepID=A0A0V0Q930_PSEPJ|nr:Insulin-like growth factor binding protein, N-terminal [Pseudocohnilembus persalinus]|eukprot:KRW98694.1 Insulin-like growth factor binding protein, N-terminal [Pseudocohnilembus persalinus]